MTSPVAPRVAANAGDPRSAARRRRGYWIPGVIALVVLLGIGLGFGAGDLNHRGPTTLAGPQIAQDLAQAIQAKEATPTPPTVHCPDSEPARAGLRFACAVTQAGATRAVDVTETNGRGGLSWHFGT